ncbi:MAG: hypothetical protein QOJ99_882 [Bryobacterales bacterium]|jgi:hypothetical protein|nr:hypothetical protein [Bryobacterales bacterium]
MKGMDGSAASTWRAVFDKHHSALIDELASRLDSELHAAVSAVTDAERENAARQIESARRSTAEALNQTLRRMRLAPSEAAILQLLADATAAWADKLVVLSFENNQARSVGSRNLNGTGFSFETDKAGAIRSVLDSHDPMVALASPAEISPSLADAFAEPDNDSPKAYLFPVLVRQKVVAMLIAVGAVVPAPLELLSEAAGMKLELLTAPPPLAPLRNPELVQIAAPSVPPSATSERRLWEELSPDDQKLHLQAQRVARVRVAELRLYNAEELRKGTFEGDIYGALREGIDAARTAFLQSFLSKSPTMVDYLHLEILRSLAHDDDRLLGKEYPGPMV